MNIDSSLVDFQTNVGGNLSQIENEKVNLSSDISALKSINISISDSLFTSFKSEAGDSIKPEIEYINQTISKIQESLEVELWTAISKAQELNSGIDELKILLDEYNSAKDKYNSLKNDEEHKSQKSAAYSAMNAAYNNFVSKQSELLQKLKELKSLDSSLNILDSYSSSDNSLLSSLSSSFTAKFDGNVQFSSVYYESDGVIYQKIIPICNNGVSYVPDEQYTIVYNKNNLLAADINAGQDAIKFLTGKITGSRNDQYLWDYCNRSYSDAVSQSIAKVMNQILEDTYKANNASTISDYAGLSAMVATTSLLHLGYSSNTAEKTLGYSQVLARGGGLDCIGFVRWCYSQGLYKTGVVKYGQNAEDYYGNGTSMTPLNLLSNHSYDLSKMSINEKMNIEIGSVLSKPTDNNYHVGIVIGHTKLQNGEPAVIVAQSSNTKIGANTRVYSLESLGQDGEWKGLSTTNLMTKRVVYGSTSATRVNA